MTFLLARLDAAITRVVTCVADKVFEAIDAALFPGLDIDGAEWLTDWEAEHEVHEPPPVNCPVGGQCPTGCDRTHAGCVTIWGNDADHAEAVERNRFYTSMKSAPLTVLHDDGTSRVIPAGEWYLEPTDDK